MSRPDQSEKAKITLALMKNIEVSHPEYFRSMIEGLMFIDDSVRNYAFLALKQHEEKAIPAVIEALKTAKAADRILLVEFLSKCGEKAKNALTVLKSKLNSNDKNIRKSIVDAVSHIGPNDPEVLIWLKSVSEKDRSTVVRKQAAYHLRRMQGINK